MVQDTNHLLLKMNEVNDRSFDEKISKNEKLSQFFNWLDKKSKSIDIECKPAAIRAFYFDLSLALDTAYNSTYDYSFRFKLSPALDPIFTQIPNYLYRVIDFIYSNSENLHILPLDLDLDLALTFPLAHQFTSLFSKTLVYILDIPNLSDLPNSAELKERLVEMWDNEPAAYSNNPSDIDCINLVKKLGLVVIEYRNIIHNWKFSKEEKKLLEDYYESVYFLATCLNSAEDSHNISSNVKNEIEKSLLLLPIAEIEKRNREKVEYQDRTQTTAILYDFI
jgi:hypothetical protein